MIDLLAEKKALKTLGLVIFIPVAGWGVGKAFGVPSIDWKPLAAIGLLSLIAFMAMVLGADPVDNKNNDS
ncbi:hypothetical protein [Azotobacter beijerinckii]|uniref:hypothetical protein n=1 Tax=Azotobacter beijerinckii TaxID=170623 RepID=UPI001113601C|nr:hypothetical protein [Azotobacter beijerinckii]